MVEVDPYPSGGAVAARVAEMAASLAAAAADASREHWPDAGGARAQAQALTRRAGQLAESGAGAYGRARWALARRGDATRGEDQTRRDWRLGLAVEEAAQAPLQLAASGADIAELAAEIAKQGADDVRADAVIAALLAAAAARAAAGLVQVNLVVGDKEPAVAACRYAEAAAAAAARAENL